MTDWKLGRKRPACTRCERDFDEGEPFFSSLLITGDEISREDACTTCFERASEDTAGAPEQLIFWRTHHRTGKKALAVDFEALEGFFLALEGRAEERLRELRYLLTLLLMRKKRLKLVRTARRKDGEIMLMRRPRRTEELAVYVFDLTPERAERLRGDLRRIFEGAELDDLLKEEPADVAEPEERAESKVEDG
ncbi:MAG: hypothetical protein O7B99_10325 [Planctomycetota bacterium]|nr:hypothetical protein [Planctomycetota bacterium]